MDSQPPGLPGTPPGPGLALIAWLLQPLMAGPGKCSWNPSTILACADGAAARARAMAAQPTTNRGQRGVMVNSGEGVALRGREKPCARIANAARGTNGIVAT